MFSIVRYAVITVCALAILAGCATQKRMTLAEFARRGEPVVDTRVGSAERIACAGGVVRSAEDAARYAACEVIEGDLAVQGTSLENLEGFANLREVRGTLGIVDNPRLDSLDGLRQLAAVERLVLSNDPQLQSLVGLERLRAVEGLILHRTGAYTVAGLEHLRRVGDLVVTENPKLISLSGLNGVTRAGSVQIESNPRLAAQGGLLRSLRTVAAPIVLKSNLGLSNKEIAELTTKGRLLMAEAKH